MHRCSLALGAAAVLLAALPSSAAGQTITHQVNGQSHRFDFKQRPLNLPRGPKNIPWDEPGKISGVPGVDERRGTDLPSARAPRARTPVALGHGRKQTPSGLIADEFDAAQRTKPTPHAGVPEDLSRSQHTTNVEVDPTQRPNPLTDGSAKAVQNPPSTRQEDKEIRAAILADAVARAVAEEQRRLAIEKSRDRRGASSETYLQDPATTGAVGSDAAGRAGLALAPGAQPTAERQSTLCRLFFFGKC